MKLKRILIRISNLRAKTRRLEDKAGSIYKKYKNKYLIHEIEVKK